MEGFYVKNDVQICPMSFLIIEQTFWPFLGVYRLYCSGPREVQRDDQFQPLGDVQTESRPRGVELRTKF